ncbi:MAG: helix-turn-helix domain-containing protein [Rhodococcus sp.]|nr:helix-turn-helix domain-containing protein [Rhodococcus sp. (in: high G+C Gram-positive bacteria)]
MSDGQYLADVVHKRRKELGLSLAAVVERGGPSEPTMVRIESGRTPPLRAPTFRKLDQALNWQPGSAMSVYAGGEPLNEAGDERGPALRSGELRVAVGSLTALVEAANSITHAARIYEPVGGALTDAIAELRSALSPLVGRVVSAMLASNASDGLPAARVAQAIEAFMSRPADDETPARTAANKERRQLHSQVSSSSEDRPAVGGGSSDDKATDVSG